MTNHFADRWTAMVSDHPTFNRLRPWESKGATTGYLNKVFFKPESGRKYTEDEVRSYIDRFVDAVRTGWTTVKPSQSAFMRFTGWWGRGDAGTVDSVYGGSVDDYLR
jgi:hypothetical protein